MNAKYSYRNIKVCCLNKAELISKEWNATHVLSLLDPEPEFTLVPKIEKIKHLKYYFYDQERENTSDNFAKLITEIFCEIDSIFDGSEVRLLVHCHAGASRSTAMAYGIIAYLQGEGNESESFLDLLKITNKPWPNRKIIQYIDNFLLRNGKLVRQLDIMREQKPKRILAYRKLNKKRGITSKVER